VSFPVIPLDFATPLLVDAGSLGRVAPALESTGRVKEAGRVTKAGE
jgi:hypothetical protein